MKPWAVWALFGAALAAAYAAQGWRGLVLVFTIAVFSLLFQLTRLTRALKRLAARPLGVVSNAVMFNAQLAQDMPLLQVLKITDSLGRAVGDQGPGDAAAVRESFVWTDSAGDAVQVDLRDGRVHRWALLRADR